jgi:nuclear pore complex protein Nup155
MARSKSLIWERTVKASPRSSAVLTSKTTQSNTVLNNFMAMIDWFVSHTRQYRWWQNCLTLLLLFQTLQVVSVHAVPATESGAIHLVAVTRGGHRLYFTTSERHRGRRLAYDRSQRPVGLELLHVRFPPQNAGPSNPTFPQKAGYLLNDVRVAFYGHGVFVAAEPSPERQHQDMLVGIGNDNAKLLPRTSYSSRAGFYESFNNAELDGKAWALAEIPLSTFAKVPAALIDNMSLRSELATQHLIPPRQFACLTSAGMIIFEKLRPVDRLQDILIRTRGAESAEMKAFFQNYNADQACAMCLTLACGSSSKASFGARDVDLAQFATHAFFNYGGRPYYEVPASFGSS